MRLLTALLLTLPLLVATPGAASAAKPPVPAGPATGLTKYAKPSDGVEGFAAYVPQVSCNPQWLPGVQRFRDLVMATYPAGEDWGSLRNCTDDGTSEHLDGRAWDWHVDARDKAAFAAATDLINWLLAPGPKGEDAYWARRLGIMYIGYNHRIWGSYRAAEGWRPLSKSDPHTDHVHFSFSWAGALGRTSFFSGKVAAEDYGPCRSFVGVPAPLRAVVGRNPRPCGAPKPLARDSAKLSRKLLWRGSTGREVQAVQAALKVSPEPGVFGPETMRAVLRYQQRKGLPATGAVDVFTRLALAEDRVLSR